MKPRWPITKLSDVCIKISDGTHHSPQVQHDSPGPGRFKYITSKNLRPWGLDLSDIAYIDADVHEGIFARCDPEFGDVLLTKDGANTGMVAVNTLDEPFSLLSSVALLKPDRTRINPQFLRYFLQSPLGVSRISDKMTGTAIRRIILRQIKEAEISVAPLHEQQRIVAEIEKQFTRLDAAVGSLNRGDANLRRYRSALLRSAFEGSLSASESAEEQLKVDAIRSDPKDEFAAIPAGWRWSTLGSIATLKGGVTKDQNRKYTASARTVPYLRVANVQRGYLDLREVKEIVATEEDISELALKKGDILFNEGGDRDKLGRGWIWNEEIDECIHQNHVFRARLHEGVANPKFVSWFANTFGQRFFFDEGKHTTNLASISMSKLKQLPIPLPPLAEQHRIVSEVERRLSVVDELERAVETNLQRAKNLRQSILQRAFSGQL